MMNTGNIKDIETFTGKEWWVNVSLNDKIRGNAPALKGSFICLGCWFNLFNKKSMAEFDAMLKWKGITRKGKEMARAEHREAVIAAGKWQRDPDLWFLYDAANKQGDWSVKF